MTTTLRQSAVQAAALILFALVASACGAVDTIAEQQERAVETSAAPAPLPAPAPSGPTPPTSDPTGGHQYGASLDEWADTERQQTDGSVASDASQSESGLPEIEWDDLIPPGASGQELVAQFEERLDAVEPGTVAAEELYAEMQAAYDPEAVNFELDGRKIRLAGFVAPLTYDDDIITEFLLVPTFGACIHVPPPPANQTVMVSADKANGLTLDDSWGAVWVEGTMVIESGTTDLGATSYRITEVTSGPYSDF